MKKKTIKTQKSSPTAMLMVGATKESVQEARSVVLEVLNSEKAGDTAKVAAFETLRHMCEIKQVNISNCNFENRAG